MTPNEPLQEREQLELGYQKRLLDAYLSNLRRGYESLKPTKRQALLTGLESLIRRLESNYVQSSVQVEEGPLSDEIMTTYGSLMNMGEKGRKILGNYLKGKRAALGLSQETLAKEAHVHENSIRRWENGESKTHASNLYGLFNALGDCSDFVDYCASHSEE